MKVFTIRTLIWLVVAGIAGVVASMTAGLLVFVVGMAFLIWRLTAALRLKPLYGLVIEVAGAQVDAIWGLDMNDIQRLTETIVEKMKHPDAPSTVIKFQRAPGAASSINPPLL
ncbi:hypothetical protein [Alloactinosynnema sp. L-07]|nr:hypothetical protein [Alloactinosynnema sp. L-07]